MNTAPAKDLMSSCDVQRYRPLTVGVETESPVCVISVHQE
jgi:hypothetical protein